MPKIDNAVLTMLSALNASHEVTDTIAPVLSGALTDLHRIADALEKMTTPQVTINKYAPVTVTVDNPGAVFADNEPLESQVQRLATHIVSLDIGEPSQSQGAIDTAIRLLTELKERRNTPLPLGSADDFAAWLTVQPEMIKVGASEPVYPMFDALKKYQSIKQLTPDAKSPS